MAPDQESTPRRSWPWWRVAITGLSSVALLLSVYLAWHYLVGGSVIGCTAGSPCEEVLTSRWSAIKGIIPVSGLAMGTYLAILLASFFIGPATPPADRRLAWGAIVILTAAAAGSAAWFIYVQKVTIGAFCPYCMATHITGLLLAMLVIWRTFSPDKTSSTDTAPSAANGATSRVFRPLQNFSLALAGFSLAAILAASQVLLTPPSVYHTGETPDAPIVLNPQAVPLVGSPDAPYLVNLFFDYKCPHCQKVHAMLDEAITRFNGKLAFALCPAPLNTHCNPYVPRDVDEFKDSCELAKIGLAVWVAKREAFPEFDRWMFSPEPGQPWHPRTLDAARAKAVASVGQANFDAARADPWIDHFMQTSIEIFGTSIRLQQSSNAVPKLVFGPHWVTPEPDSVDDLVSILHDSLALPQP